MDYDEMELDEMDADVDTLEADEDLDVEEGFDLEEDEFAPEESFDALADAAMDGDEEEEDEFLGALAGLAAKAVPALAGGLVPKVFKWGKKILRGFGRRRSRRRRRVIRAAPKIVRRTARIIRRKPTVYRRNPSRIGLVLNRVTREYVRRYAR